MVLFHVYCVLRSIKTSDRFTHTHTPAHKYAHVCVRACVRACVRVCVCVCVCVSFTASSKQINCVQDAQFVSSFSHSIRCLKQINESSQTFSSGSCLLKESSFLNRLVKV